MLIKLNVIKEINADIIALQEVENYSVLENLAKSLDYQFYSFAKPKGSPFGLECFQKRDFKLGSFIE